MRIIFLIGICVVALVGCGVTETVVNEMQEKADTGILRGGRFITTDPTRDDMGPTME